MHIDLFLDTELEAARLENLFAFLVNSGIAPEGATLGLSGPLMQQPLPYSELFVVSNRGEQPDLEVAFLNEKRLHNASLVKNHLLPKLLVGVKGLPTGNICASVPFEHKRFLSRWLRPVLETARNYEWQAELLHCEHSIVGKQIVKLAQWFQMDAVKEAMGEWLTQDVEKYLTDIIHEFPNVFVHVGLGHLPELLQDRDTQVLLLGSLRSGYHIPGRHHGMNYSALLTLCGGSGYFLAE